MKTVFAVRVVTKDMITDTFAKFRSIIGGRVKSYENIISEAITDGYNELLLKHPSVKNIKITTTEMIRDGAELIIYGEITDEEYAKSKSVS